MNKEKMNSVIEEICDKCCPYAKEVNAGQMDEETFEAHCAGVLDCPSLNLMDAVDGVIDDEEKRRQEEQETETDDHYYQLRKARQEIIGLIEESGEARADLIEMIGEEMEWGEDEPHSDRDNMIEVIADVYQMLDQLCMRLDIKNAEQDNTHYDRLCRSAAHFGIRAQMGKAREELRELDRALETELTEVAFDREATMEEIADLYNMLDQLCILMCCEDEVQEIAEAKMVRTIERIESGYYEETPDGNI